MEFSDILGFVVLMFFMVIPVIKKIAGSAQAQKKQALSESVYYEEEYDEVATVAPSTQKPIRREQPRHQRLLKKDYELDSAIEGRQVPSKVGQRTFHSKIESRQNPSQVVNEIIEEWDQEDVVANKKKSLFSEPGSLRKMIIMHEIINPKY
jgi:hypothetical protein